MSKFVVNPATPDILVMKRAKRFMLFAIGVFALAAALGFTFLGIHILNNSTDGQSNANLCFGIAVFSFLVSLVLFLFKSGITLDRQTQTITGWWGICCPFRRTAYDWKDFKQVAVTHETRHVKDSSYSVFPVRLQNEETGKKLHIEENHDYLASRSTAEMFSKFIQIPMADSSTDTLVIREHTQLDETVRERIRKSGKATEVPAFPASSKIQQQTEGNEVVLSFPSKGWWGSPILMLLGGIVLLVIFVFILVVIWGYNDGDAEMNRVGRTLFASLIFIPAVLLIGYSTYVATFHFEIRVSPERFQIRKASKLSKSTQEMPVNQLEELRMTKVRGIVFQTQDATQSVLNKNSLLVRSDYATIIFGSGLTDEELKWLLALIESTISADVKS